MQKIAIIIVTILMTAIAWHLSHMIPLTGYFASLEPKLVEQCRQVDIAPGTEDVTIDSELGLAFITAANRRTWYLGDNNNAAPENGVYTLSLDGSDTVRKVSGDIEGFLPHGLYLWKDGDERRLFVISHPPDGRELVELFDVAANGDLTHLETISFPEMFSPNDIVATGPRSFYATNDQRFDEGLLGWLETNMAIPLSSIAYFNSDIGSFARKHLFYANGINISPDGSQIYVAEVVKRRIGVFDIDHSTGELSRVRNIAVNTAPDNIEIDADGNLWTAGHSRVLEFIAHAQDETAIAASHAIKIDPATGDTTDVFISRNGEINGSSVAAANEDTLIIGAVFDGHVMVCPLN